MTRELLQQLVGGRFGLTPRDSWGSDLERVTAELSRRTSLAPDALVARLERDPALLRQLAGGLTIDETYFLRQPEQFDLVLGRLQKALPPAAGLRRPFVVWSAGCSHGEEPYSLAILLAERLPWARAQVRILANDLSADAVRLARAGVYTDWSMRGVPDWFRARYFRRTDAGWALDEAIRRAVTFENLSIGEQLEQLADRTVDVIFFRNVAIYLDARTLEALYRGFARVLAPDGWLVLGASDPVPARELFSLGESSTYHRSQGPQGKPEARPAARAFAAPLPRASPLSSAPSAVPPPAAPTQADGAQALYRHARQLGDEGRGAQALEVASRVVAAAPSWGEAWQLRGTLLLEASRPREAAEDLRRAVFLEPERPTARFWYATALRGSGLAAQARAEARTLVSQLERLPGATLLEDCTPAGDLLQAARGLLEEP
ncbi:MAG: CheR family methyltransferase [Myxococcales bacterium]